MLQILFAALCLVPFSITIEQEKVLTNNDLLPHTQPNTSKIIDSIAIASCFRIGKKSIPETFSRIVSQNPDLFLWLGDNIYSSDTQDMAIMRQRYDEKKRSVGYPMFLEGGIPVMANWDDHDFGSNNDGKYFPKKKESQLEFLRHFDIPGDDPRYSGQEGIYSSKVFGAGTGKSLHVIMLDNRYGRSPTFNYYGKCEGDDTKMLSDEQWRWLELELEIPSELKIIANGIQILPPTNYDNRPFDQYCAYGDGKLFNQSIANLGETGLSGTKYESWSEIPIERERLLRLVQKSINDGFANNIIFVSGDQHWAEFMQKNMPADSQAGGEVTLFEFTASGIGQNWEWSSSNPNRMPIWADFQGDGNFNRPCLFPFNYGLGKQDGCVYSDPMNQPWCYTQVDSSGNGVVGMWGYCAPTGSKIPTGQVGTIADDIYTQTTQNRHIIDIAESNYGKIDIDWEKELVTLSIQNSHEEVVSTIIPFDQEKIMSGCVGSVCDTVFEDLDDRQEMWNKAVQTVYSAYVSSVQLLQSMI